MPIIPKADNKISLPKDSKLAVEFGLTLTEAYGYNYYFLESDIPHFAGRVLSTAMVTHQVMSDVWEDYRHAKVACENGTVEDICVHNADVIVDIEPHLKALVEERAKALELAARVVENAEKAYDNAEPRLRRGDKAEVIRGRKIPIGSEVEVFWVGSVRNKFNGQNELRAGVKHNGETVWVAACNLEPIPSEQEIADRIAAKLALENAQKAQENVKALYDAPAIVAA